MLYVSELNGKTYKTIAELEKAEAEIKAEEKKKEALKAERAERAAEVEAAFKAVSDAQKKADDLLNKFLNDYGSFHTTLKGANTFPLHDSLFDFMLNNF